MMIATPAGKAEIVGIFENSKGTIICATADVFDLMASDNLISAKIRK